MSFHRHPPYPFKYRHPDYLVILRSAVKNLNPRRKYRDQQTSAPQAAHSPLLSLCANRTSKVESMPSRAFVTFIHRYTDIGVSSNLARQICVELNRRAKELDERERALQADREEYNKGFRQLRARETRFSDMLARMTLYVSNVLDLLQHETPIDPANFAQLGNWPSALPRTQSRWSTSVQQGGIIGYGKYQYWSLPVPLHLIICLRPW
jgi:hypothetical protein